MRNLARIHRNLNTIAIKLKYLMVSFLIHVVKSDSLEFVILGEETDAVSFLGFCGISKGAGLKIKM